MAERRIAVLAEVGAGADVEAQRLPQRQFESRDRRRRHLVVRFPGVHRVVPNGDASTVLIAGL